MDWRNTKHWSIQKIKRTSYVKGRIGWQGLTTQEFTDKGPFLITGTDFEDGKINWKTCNHVEQWRFEQDPYIQIKNNDVIITKDGTIGKIAYVTDLPGNTTLNSGVMVVRPLQRAYLPYYLFWILNSGQFTEFINIIKTGTTIQHLYQETFGNFQFLLPKIDEQKQISDFLDSQTKLIDSQIGSNQKLVTLLQEKRQSTINHAVTKGLDPNAPMKDSGIEWIGEIPEQWNIFKLKHLGKSITGLTYQPEDVAENQTKGILVLRASNIQNRSLSLEDTVYVDVPLNDELLTKEGDILICSRSGSRDLIGKNLTISKDLSGCTFGAFMTVFRSCFSEFISKVMNSSIFTNQSGLFNTSTINQLTLGVLNNFVIPFPIDINEQKQISDFLDKQTTKIDSLISKTQTQITKLKEFRQSLISAAVTGKIDVSN